jgi:hypothetical protein
MSELQICKLLDFKSSDKFSEKKWIERRINPSLSEVSQKLEKLFQESTERLINAIQKDEPKEQLSLILEQGLLKFKAVEYDTEEREFISELFNELSIIVNIDFRQQLNTWLYGKLLANVFKKKKTSQP